MTGNTAAAARRRRVAALTLYPYGDTPGQRFRIQQWEPYLNEAGIDIDYYSFADERLVELLPAKGRVFSKIWALGRGFFSRLSHLFKLRGYDAVFIYRAAAIVGPAVFERLIAISRIPIVYDFDDAIFLTHTAETNRSFAWAKFASKTAAICRLSAAVTVGNNYLADYARQYNDNVYLVPTGVDTDDFQPRERQPASRTVVGWVGSSTSQTYLEAFEPTLQQLLDSRDVELRVISDRRPNFNDLEHTWIPWSRDDEIKQISAFDIGIMPMPDDEWARGKCAFKALQYMSLGVPAICSDVGANRDVIEHGVNGMLAATADEWLNAFTTLVDDAEMRRKLGVRARETIVSRYSMRTSSEAFIKAIRSVFQ